MTAVDVNESNESDESDESKQKRAARFLANAIYETVAEFGPEGVPGGPLYAALLPYEVSLIAFQQLMDVLVYVGKLRQRGDFYIATKWSEPHG